MQAGSPCNQGTDWKTQVLNSAGAFLFILLLKQCFFFPNKRNQNLLTNRLLLTLLRGDLTPQTDWLFSGLCGGCIPQSQSCLRSSHTSWLSFGAQPSIPNSTCSLPWNPIFASLLSTNVKVEARARSKKFRKNFSAFAKTCRVRYRGTDKLWRSSPNHSPFDLTVTWWVAGGRPGCRVNWSRGTRFRLWVLFGVSSEQDVWQVWSEFQ